MFVIVVLFLAALYTAIYWMFDYSSTHGEVNKLQGWVFNDTLTNANLQNPGQFPISKTIFNDIFHKPAITES